MELFEKVFNATVLKYESPIEENSRDIIKRYGLSLRFLKSIDDPRKYGFYGACWEKEDVESLSLDNIKDIYHDEYWKHVPFEKIIDDDLRNYLFDTAITIGIAPAIKLLQRTCWVVNGYKCIDDNGILDDETIDVANNYAIVDLLISERAGHLRLIAEKNPDQKDLLEGWLKRCYGG